MTDKPMTAASRHEPPGVGEGGARSRSVLDDVLAGPLQQLAVFGGLALLVALGLLLTVSWRGMQRLEPFYLHLEQQDRLQEIRRDLDMTMDRAPDAAPTSAELAPIKAGLAQLLATQAFSIPSTAERLADVVKRLDVPLPRIDELAAARVEIGEVIESEKHERRSDLHRIRYDARSEIILATLALLVLPMTAFVVIRVMRDQITQPLRDLSHLLTLIGEERHRPAPTTNVATPILPIMEGYNRLVDRLTTALQTNRRYQGQLQSQVEAAAQTLVRQRAELADADRLAAVGEISARVAHELRNPLAGIKAAISNLLQESVDAEQKERLQQIGAEVDRMARLLDRLLVRGRRPEEMAADVDLGALITDLLALIRYQVSPLIDLRMTSAPGIVARVQRDGLRQMLLNLVLNASQAIGSDAGHITVTVEIVNRTALIAVEDDGPGFPDELLERGMRPFVSRRPEGSGLGLSTVQRMARDMGGDLEIANRAPRGARVTIRLNNSMPP